MPTLVSLLELNSKLSLRIECWAPPYPWTESVWWRSGHQTGAHVPLYILVISTHGEIIRVLLGGIDGSATLL